MVSSLFVYDLFYMSMVLQACHGIGVCLRFLASIWFSERLIDVARRQCIFQMMSAGLTLCIIVVYMAFMDC